MDLYREMPWWTCSCQGSNHGSDKIENDAQNLITSKTAHVKMMNDELQTEHNQTDDIFDEPIWMAKASLESTNSPNTTKEVERAQNQPMDIDKHLQGGTTNKKKKKPPWEATDQQSRTRTSNTNNAIGNSAESEEEIDNDVWHYHLCGKQFGYYDSWGIRKGNKQSVSSQKIRSTILIFL